MMMPYSRFMMFWGYMIYILNEETDEGRKKNKAENKKLESKYGNVEDDSVGKFKNMFKQMKNGRLKNS